MRIPIVLGLLVASPAFACPNLAGYYTYCHETYGGDDISDGNWNDLVVTQTDLPGGVEYTLNLQHGHIATFPADGNTRTREFPDGQGGTNVEKTIMTCDGEFIVARSVTTDRHQEVVVEETLKLRKIGQTLVSTEDFTAYGKHHLWTRTCK